MRKLTWLVVALLAFSLSSCSLFRHVPVNPSSASIGADGEWECTGSRENGDWDCQKVTDESEDTNTTTNVGPQIAQVNTPRPVQPGTTRIETNPPLQPKPVRINRYDPTQGVEEVNQPTTPVSTSGDVPEYRWLAINPDTPTRIEDLPDNYYAVQLAAFSDMKKANKYAADATWLIDPHGVRTVSNGKEYYVILLGIYETKTRAERAANSITKHLGSDKPWIRSMTSLKPAIRAASRAGSSDRL
ncbi:MAG: SPOR domain-containing protein [Gammaproteobacteria bacterium]|nr:SPOR domain-containing protein [Gammaproteobacteria bacterium]